MAIYASKPSSGHKMRSTVVKTAVPKYDCFIGRLLGRSGGVAARPAAGFTPPARRGGGATAGRSPGRALGALTSRTAVGRLESN